jgi:hypothetical protein
MTPEEKQLLREIKEWKDQKTAQQVFSPIDVASQRVLRQDLPIVKSISGSTYGVEINDEQYTWDMGSGSGHTIQDEGTPLTTRTNLNFVGSSVAVTDDAGNNATKVTISAGGGAQCATFVVGPSANADSADYDYVTDGTADDVQIQAAIDALPSTGGMVLLREGTYTVASPVSSTKVRVRLAGCGGGTLIKAVSSWSTDGYLVSLTGVECFVENIKFDGNYPTVTYYSRWLSVTGAGSTVSRCEFVAGPESNGQFNSAQYVNVHSCYFDISAAAGVSALTISGTVTSCIFSVSADTVVVDGNATAIVSDNVFIIPNSYSATVIIDAAIVVNNTITAGTSISGTIISGQGAGSDTRAIGNIIYLTSSSGIGISSMRTVANNYIEMNATTATTVGIEDAAVCQGNTIFTAGEAINQVNSYGLVTNNYIYDYLGDGIVLGASYTECSNNTLLLIESATDNTYSGIKFTGARNHCVVTNNIINGNGATKDLKYGISEDTSCDYNIIEHNVVTGADTAQISVVGANTISSNNITA